MQKPVIVVHGGAGLWRPERRRAGTSGVREAAEESIKLVNRRMHGVSMGLITVGTEGQIGAAHCSQHLCWTYMASNMKKPKAALKAKTVREIE